MHLSPVNVSDDKTLELSVLLAFINLDLTRDVSLVYRCYMQVHVVKGRLRATDD